MFSSPLPSTLALSGVLAPSLATAAFSAGSQYRESTLVDAAGHYGAAAGTTTSAVPYYMPTKNFFLSFNGEEVLASNNQPIGDDMHLVTGVEDASGGVILVGSALKSSDATPKKGVAIRLPAVCADGYAAVTQPNTFPTQAPSAGNCNRLVWSAAWNSGAGKNDIIIAAESSGNDAVLVGMYDSSQYVMVLKLDTGSLSHSKQWAPTDTTNGMSAFEAVAVAGAGTVFVAGGFANSVSRAEVTSGSSGFKSAGQTLDGTAQVKAFEKTGGVWNVDTPLWQKDLGSGTVKSIRTEMGSDSVEYLVILVSTDGDVNSAKVFKVKAVDGTQVSEWSIPKSFGQATEIAVVNSPTVANKKYYFVTGLVSLGTNYYGRIRRLDGVTGAQVSFGTGSSFEGGDAIIGNPPGGIGGFAGLAAKNYVYTECFSGMSFDSTSKAQSRFVAVCGTGVEGAEVCDSMSGTLTAAEITACKADYRKSWRPLMAEINPDDGSLVSERVETFVISQSETQSGAAEYVFGGRASGSSTMPKLYVLTDENSGAGLFGYTVGGSTTDSTTTSGPTTSSTSGTTSSSSTSGSTTSGSTTTGSTSSSCGSLFSVSAMLTLLLSHIL